MPFEFLESAEHTDQGRKRKNNEDSLIRLPAHGIFCVADGMGGAAEGDVASNALVEHLERAFEAPAEPPLGMHRKLASIQATVNKASTWIKQRADDRGNKGTGTTCVLIAFAAEQPGRAVACHAGDSRLYRFRDGKLEQVTRDHSVANMAGVTDEKALPAMFRNVITRAVGLQESVELEQTPTDVRPQDIYLICSDGLSRMVNDKAIGQIVAAHAKGELPALAKALVAAANDAGGDDNISVVLVRVGALPPPSAVGDEEPVTPAVVPVTPPTVKAGGAPREDRDTADHETPTHDSVPASVLASARATPPSAPTAGALSGAAAPTPPATHAAQGLPWGLIGGGLAIAAMIAVLVVIWKLRGDGVVGPKPSMPELPPTHPAATQAVVAVAVPSTVAVATTTAPPASPPPTTRVPPPPPTTAPVAARPTTTSTRPPATTQAAPPAPTTTSRPPPTTTTTSTSTTTTSTTAPRPTTTTSTTTTSTSTTTTSSSTTTSSTTSTSTSTTTTSTTTTTVPPPTTTSSTTSTTTTTTAEPIPPAVQQVRAVVASNRKELARFQALLPHVAELPEFTRMPDPALAGALAKDVAAWAGSLDAMDAWLGAQAATPGAQAPAEAESAIRNAGALREAAYRRLAGAQAAIPQTVGSFWSNYADDVAAAILDELSASANQVAVLLAAGDRDSLAELRPLTLDVLQQVHTVLPKLKARMQR